MTTMLKYALLIVSVLVVEIFWFWVLLDCLMKETCNEKKRMVWSLAILCTNIFGAIAYLMFRRPFRVKESKVQ